MDWLDKAAQGYKFNQEKQLESTKIADNIKSSYSEKVQELWLLFKDAYEQVNSKFGGPSAFSAKGNEMHLIVANVEIKGVANEVNLAGGYYGKVKIEIRYPSSSRVGNVHFDDILLGEYQGKPTWKYRAYINERMEDVLFSQDDVEKVFKSAFSIYL